MENKILTELYKRGIKSDIGDLYLRALTYAQVCACSVSMAVTQAMIEAGADL